MNISSFDSEHPLMRIGFRVEKPPVSASALSCFHTCERKFMFRYRLGLVPRVFVLNASHGGQWLHQTLRSLVLGETVDDVRKRLQLAADEAVAKSVTPDGVVPPGLPEKIGREMSAAIASGKAFWDIVKSLRLPTFDPSYMRIDGVEKQVFAEVAVYDGRDPIPIAGTIDLLTTDVSTGETDIHDYKRLQGIPSQRAKPASIEPQPWFYRLLVESLGLKPVRFIHWILQSPTIRQRKGGKTAKGETFDEYLARVESWYRTETERRPNDPPIARSTLSLPVLTTGRRRMLVDTHRACNSVLVSADAFPETGASHACMQYGRECPYLDLCVRDPALWTDTILNNFVQEFRYDDRVESTADASDGAE